MRKFVTFGFVLVGFITVQMSVAARAFASCDVSGVRLEYVSQRQLSEQELRQFDDLFGISLVVKLRLVNDGDCTIYFLSDKNFIRPRGYQMYRKNGSSVWEYLPPSRGRDGAPGTEFTAASSMYLGLLPNSTIEYETFDWSRTDEQHAFTTFIKLRADAESQEISSKPFAPLIK